MVDGARDAGLAASDFANDSDEAGEMLLKEVRGSDVVLIKGSRGRTNRKSVGETPGKIRT
jgi:UDP-N-acetylmuramyl pentapeptide synthase